MKKFRPRRKKKIEEDSEIKNLLDEFDEFLEEEEVKELQDMDSVGRALFKQNVDTVRAIINTKGAARYLVEERRKQVLELRRRGIDPSVMAQMLGVSIKIIDKDLAEIDKQLKDSVKGFDTTFFIGDTLSLYESLEVQAWQQYEQTPTGGKERKEYLNLIKAIRSDRVKLLQELGLIQKKGEATHQTTVNIMAIQEWGTKKRREISKSIISMGLPELEEPELDENFVIDGDYEEAK